MEQPGLAERLLCSTPFRLQDSTPKHTSDRALLSQRAPHCDRTKASGKVADTLGCLLFFRRSVYVHRRSRKYKFLRQAFFSLTARGRRNFLPQNSLPKLVGIIWTQLLSLFTTKKKNWELDTTQNSSCQSYVFAGEMWENLFQCWFLLGSHNHQANLHVHQQHVVCCSNDMLLVNVWICLMVRKFCLIWYSV